MGVVKKDRNDLKQDSHKSKDVFTLPEEKGNMAEDFKAMLRASFTSFTDLDSSLTSISDYGGSSLCASLVKHTNNSQILFHEQNESCSERRQNESSNIDTIMIKKLSRQSLQDFEKQEENRLQQDSKKSEDAFTLLEEKGEMAEDFKAMLEASLTSFSDLGSSITSFSDSGESSSHTFLSDFEPKDTINCRTELKDKDKEDKNGVIDEIIIGNERILAESDKVSTSLFTSAGFQMDFPLEHNNKFPEDVKAISNTHQINTVKQPPTFISLSPVDVTHFPNEDSKTCSVGLMKDINNRKSNSALNKLMNEAEQILAETSKSDSTPTDNVRTNMQPPLSSSPMPPTSHYQHQYSSKDVETNERQQQGEQSQDEESIQNLVNRMSMETGGSGSTLMKGSLDFSPDTTVLSGTGNFTVGDSVEYSNNNQSANARRGTFKISNTSSNNYNANTSMPSERRSTGNDSFRRHLPTRSQPQRRDSHQSISITLPFRSRDSSGYIIAGGKLLEEGKNVEEAEMGISHSSNKQIHELDNNNGVEKSTITESREKNKPVITATKNDTKIIIIANNKKGRSHPPPLSPMKVISIPRNRRGSMVSTLSLEDEDASISHHYGANNKFTSDLSNVSPGLRQSQRQQHPNDNSHRYNYNNDDNEVASAPLQSNRSRRDSHQSQSIKPPSRKENGHINESHVSQQIESPTSGISNQGKSCRYFVDNDITHGNIANRGINDGYDENKEDVEEASGMNPLDRTTAGTASDLGKTKSCSLLPMTNFEKMTSGNIKNATSKMTSSVSLTEVTKKCLSIEETEIKEDSRSHDKPSSVVVFSHNEKGSVVSTLTLENRPSDSKHEQHLATSRSGQSKDRCVSYGHIARLSPSPPHSKIYQDLVGLSAISSVDRTTSLDYSRNSGSIAMDAVKPNPHNNDDNYNNNEGEEEALIEKVNKKAQKQRSTFKASNTSKSSPRRQSRTRVYQKPGNILSTPNGAQLSSQQQYSFSPLEEYNNNLNQKIEQQKKTTMLSYRSQLRRQAYQQEQQQQQKITHEDCIISIPRDKRRGSTVSALSMHDDVVFNNKSLQQTF